MTHNEIEEGKTYLFRATDSEARQHLVGQPFKVVAIRKVWRLKWRDRNKSREQVWRYFNEDGVGARADELGELNDDLPF